jgi:hypothetical protein
MYLTILNKDFTNLTMLLHKVNILLINCKYNKDTVKYFTEVLFMGTINRISNSISNFKENRQESNKKADDKADQRRENTTDKIKDFKSERQESNREADDRADRRREDPVGSVKDYKASRQESNREADERADRRTGDAISSVGDSISDYGESRAGRNTTDTAEINDDDSSESNSSANTDQAISDFRRIENGDYQASDSSVNEVQNAPSTEQGRRFEDTAASRLGDNSNNNISFGDSNWRTNDRREQREEVAAQGEERYDEQLVENGEWDKTENIDPNTGDRTASYSMEEGDRAYDITLDPNNGQNVENRSIQQNGEQVYADNGTPQVNNWADGMNAIDLEDKTNPETQSSQQTEQPQSNNEEWRTNERRETREEIAARKEEKYDEKLVENGDWEKRENIDSETGDRSVSYNKEDGNKQYEVALDPNSGKYVEERSVQKDGKEVYNDAGGRPDIDGIGDAVNYLDMRSQMRPDQQAEQAQGQAPTTQPVQGNSLQDSMMKYHSGQMEVGQFANNAAEGMAHSQGVDPETVPDAINAIEQNVHQNTMAVEGYQSGRLQETPGSNMPTETEALANHELYSQGAAAEFRQDNGLPSPANEQEVDFQAQVHGANAVQGASDVQEGWMELTNYTIAGNAPPVGNAPPSDYS